MHLARVFPYSLNVSIRKHLDKRVIMVLPITSTLLSRQNKRNLCYRPILVTGKLRNCIKKI